MTARDNPHGREETLALNPLSQDVPVHDLETLIDVAEPFQLRPQARRSRMMDCCHRIRSRAAPG